MTNREIIFRQSILLMERGILSGSGTFGTYTDENGNEKQIEFPETIHTFSAWKQAGFIVKKGEHACAAFPVWKYAERQTEASEDETEAENAQPAGRMFMKKAFFFKRSQVEKITA
jgi:hypothetical protein